MNVSHQIVNAGLNHGQKAGPVRFPGSGGGDSVSTPQDLFEPTEVSSQSPTVSEEFNVQLSKRLNRRTKFEYDFQNKEVIAKVIDGATREEIKQIPNETLLAISKGINEYSKRLEELSIAVGEINGETPNVDHHA